MWRYFNPDLITCFGASSLNSLVAGGKSRVTFGNYKEPKKAEYEIGNHFFLFDYDGKPTSLSDSTHVKLRQLKRYCLENYLLDVEIITDLTRDRDFAASPINSITDTSNIMKRLALGQLNDVAAREVYKQLGLESVGFDMKVLNNSDPIKIADKLWSQIDRRALFGVIS